MKRKYFRTLALVGSLSVATVPAAAQTVEERAGARAAADQGYDAFKAGRWSEAVDLFARAESLVHSPVHLLFLARSHAKLDHLLEAQEAYLRLLREPVDDQAPAAIKRVRRDAERELSDLEPLIPSVTVEVQGLSESDAYEVTQDDRSMPRALIGMSRPVNPGEHTWRGVSGGQEVTERRLIQRGTQTRVVLRLTAPRPSAAVASTEGGLAAPMSDQDRALYETDTTGPSPLVYAGFGVAAVGLGVGIGFLVHKNNLEGQVTGCNPDCPPTRENRDRADRADRAGMISAVGFIGGGVGLATAITLLLVGGDEGPEMGGVRPWVGVNSAGVSGRF